MEVIDLTMDDDDNDDENEAVPDVVASKERHSLKRSASSSSATAKPTKRRKGKTPTAAPTTPSIASFFQTTGSSSSPQMQVDEPPPPQPAAAPVIAEAQVQGRSSKEFWTEEVQQLADQLPLPVQGDMPLMQNLFFHEQPKWFQAKQAVVPSTAQQSEVAEQVCRGRLQGDLPRQVKPKMPKPSKRSKGEKPPAGKACKVQLFPTKNQRDTFNRWFRGMQWTYNTCLAKVKEDPEQNLDEEVLRKYCINKEALESGQFANFGKKMKDDVLKTPNMIRHGAMQDVVKAYKSNMAKQEKQ